MLEEDSVLIPIELHAAQKELPREGNELVVTEQKAGKAELSWPDENYRITGSIAARSERGSLIPPIARWRRRETSFRTKQWPKAKSSSFHSSFCRILTQGRSLDAAAHAACLARNRLRHQTKAATLGSRKSLLIDVRSLHAKQSASAVAWWCCPLKYTSRIGYRM